MALAFHPSPGTVVRIDLSDGFRPPEMVKRRPAIVLSPKIAQRDSLCTIVPLSTSEPRLVLPHHLKIQFSPPLPAPYSAPEMWLKGDIVLTVAFHRLRLLFQRFEDGRRVYDERVLDPAVFEQVRACVRSGLGL